MISFDDLIENNDRNDALINDLKSSVYILSNQQQTFESDLNDMMIDIQLISNSLSTLTGGGGNEYSAAARVKGISIEDIKEKLDVILNPATYLKSEDLSANAEMKLRLTK